MAIPRVAFPAAALVAAVVFGLVALASAPRTALAADWADALGAQAWDLILKEKRASRDTFMNTETAEVVLRVLRAAGLDARGWRFAVIEDATPNAFALPGGKIGVHTGMFLVLEN